MMLIFKRTQVVTMSTLAAIFLFTSCIQRKQEPCFTWLYGYGQVEKLNGKVKKLVDKRWGNSKTLPGFEYIFDSKGDVVKIKNGFQNGSDTASYNTVYSSDGRKAESIGLYSDKGKHIKEIYKYDNNGHLTRFIGNANNPTSDTTRFFYDNSDNLTEQHEYFEKKPLWKFKFKYLHDKHGVCDGVVQSTTTWHDNFKSVDNDTTRYIAFDFKNNWLKAVSNGDTLIRPIFFSKIFFNSLLPIQLKILIFANSFEKRS